LPLIAALVFVTVVPIFVDEVNVPWQLAQLAAYRAAPPTGIGAGAGAVLVDKACTIKLTFELVSDEGRAQYPSATFKEDNVAWEKSTRS
jgi:hypothetical protein